MSPEGLAERSEPELASARFVRGIGFPRRGLSSAEKCRARFYEPVPAEDEPDEEDEGEDEGLGAGFHELVKAGLDAESRHGHGQQEGVSLFNDFQPGGGDEVEGVDADDDEEEDGEERHADFAPLASVAALCAAEDDAQHDEHGCEQDDAHHLDDDGRSLDVGVRGFGEIGQGTEVAAQLIAGLVHLFAGGAQFFRELGMLLQMLIDGCVELLPGAGHAGAGGADGVVGPVHGFAGSDNVGDFVKGGAGVDADFAGIHIIHVGAVGGGVDEHGQRAEEYDGGDGHGALVGFAFDDGFCSEHGCSTADGAADGGEQGCLAIHAQQTPDAAADEQGEDDDGDINGNGGPADVGDVAEGDAEAVEDDARAQNLLGAEADAGVPFRRHLSPQGVGEDHADDDADDERAESQLLDPAEVCQIAGGAREEDDEQDARQE